jgi:type I restriction enzyme, S subunit
MNWKKVKLGDYINVKTGKLDANVQVENGKYPFFTCSKDHLLIDTFSYDCECVLVAGNGDLNVKYYEGKFDAYQRTYIIESKAKNILDVRYLYHFMSKYVEKLRLDSIGGVIKYIKIGNITDAKILLPDLATQKHIAEVLDKADALRQQNRQLLAHYDELLQSTFIELFGDPVKNPKGWEVKKLGEVADIVSGVAKNSNIAGDLIEAPYMRVANVQDGQLDLKEIKTINVYKRDFDRYQLKAQDVLMTEGGDPDKLGRAAIWNNEIENCIHQNHIFRVRLNTSILASIYFRSLSGSSYSKRYFFKAAKQTTGIASINMTQLKNFPALIPPLPLQQHIAKIVEQIEAQKAQAQAALAESEALFEGLLAGYFK